MNRLYATLVLSASVLAPSGVNAGAADPKAAAVLAEARKAIGGDANLAAVKTLTVAGKQNRTMGDMQMSGDFEIAMMLPDKYLRTQVDNTPMGVTLTRESGFSGDQPLIHNSSGHGDGSVRIVMGTPGVRPGETPTPEQQAQIDAQMLRAQRQDFARLVLAWLAVAPAGMPLEYVHAGEAESPDGRADVIDVKGPDNFTAKLFIDKKTRLPLMVAYRAVEPQIRTVTTAGAAGNTDPSAREAMQQMQPPPTSDIQLFFSDHRKVDGLMLPFKVSKSVDGKPTEEWDVEKIKVNPVIKPDTFTRKRSAGR
jgi:hypothetical protein